MKNDIVVIGLGNPLRGDEGIGNRLIKELKIISPEGIDLMDLCNEGVKILSALEGKKKAIFINCTFMGTSPGAIRRFSPEEVDSLRKLPDQPFNDWGLLQLLSFLSLKTNIPEEIVIYCIEPGKIMLKESISSSLEELIPFYLGLILKELIKVHKTISHPAPI